MNLYQFLLGASIATVMLVALGRGGTVGAAEKGASEDVDFNRDIRPILAANCFACHGPDEEHQEAGLRLDIRQAAIDFGALEPGNSLNSELIRRIFSDDADEVMPPPSAGHSLTDQQKALFARWVDQGAKYAEHWAFVRPAKPRSPKVQDKSWPRNGIDHFVLARLESEGMSPSPEADRYTLVRRVYLDLIGLPPTPEQADAFVFDNDPHAYEKLVDRLLKSQHYGERWAVPWLDLARYSDTNGYEKDRPRSIWLYRDWVIRALNDDMPFDQFTIEQLAGDMLESPTAQQRIATGFHRNTMLNEEGGIDPLEFRFYAMVDRVATTGSVWLGLSTGCAQCHTHKYDPITHTDFYRLMALLNNADEPDLLVRAEEMVAKRERIEHEIDELTAGLVGKFPPLDGEGPVEERRRQNFENRFAEWLAQQQQDANTWLTIVPHAWETNLPRLEVMNDGSLFATGDATKRDVYKLSFQIEEKDLPITALRIEAMADQQLPGGGPGNAYYEGRKGTFFLSEVDLKLNDRELVIESTTKSNEIDKPESEAVFDGNGSTGWSSPIGQSHQLVLKFAEPITEPGVLQFEMLFERHFVASLGKFRISKTADSTPAAGLLPVSIETLVVKSAEQLSEGERKQLLDYYVNVAPELAEARKPIDALRRKLPEFPETMVMRERPEDNPRLTFRHHRGEYTSPREEVTPGIPQFLENSGTLASNRLELARWLVSDANPLVARVAVNRAWQAIFGAGLHRTPDDFGTQSDPPSHPQLLDWLACEFVEGGWSQKDLHRTIVTSATYRQSSGFTPVLLERDMKNELLARGPRFRVGAEVVRDILLSSSGLLSAKMYGPSVRPPQPQSVTAAAYGSPKWQASEGEDRYRRSLYTFSQRTAPFAAFSVFDAPSGENCTAIRDRSNTPLQALTLMNDGMFLEMAKELARKAVELNTSETETAAYIFRRLCIRPAETEELAAILKFYEEQRKRCKAGQLSASEITGEKKGDSEYAAWITVARSLMNLDEVITKP